MLRKFAELSERFFGVGSTGRVVPISRRGPKVHLPPHRAEAYFRVVEDCLADLAARYDVKQQRRMSGLLRSLAPSGNPKKVALLHSYRLRNDERKECYWVTLTFRETFTERRSRVEDDAIRQAVIARVRFDAGNVLIRPENIRDNIAELFGSVDIDFRHEAAFSRKYFVLAEDERRVRNELPSSFMRLLSEERGLLVRILGNNVLLSRDRKIRVEDAVPLAELAFAAMECG
jgi:hypothetical protein